MKPELAEVVYGKKKVKPEHKEQANDRIKELSDFDLKNKDKEEVAEAMNEIVDLALFVMRD
jgi:hypothetical protein